MTPISETGHHKNVANFEELHTICTGYGAAYNPSNPNISITSLTQTLTSAKASLSKHKSAKADFDKMSNQREIIFNPFKKLSTRIINALESTDVPALTIGDLRTINRKIQGKRADNSMPETPTVDANNSSPETPEIKKISVAQLSFSSNIDNFSKIISNLDIETKYTPNETDLKIVNLKTKLSEMEDVNSKTISLANKYSSAIIERNKTLYAPETGLIDISKKVKKYVKSVFGASDPNFKMISKISFKTVK